jgi:hypothetical protein
MLAEDAVQRVDEIGRRGLGDCAACAEQGCEDNGGKASTRRTGHGSPFVGVDD